MAAAAMLTGCVGGEDTTIGALEQECGGPPHKVTICHIPPGNPGNAHTIRVSPAAVRAHLAHGDHRGECAPTCAPEAAACSRDNQCCVGACLSGTCTTVCAPGSATTCYDGPAGTVDVGVCAAGAMKCNAAGSGYGACVGAVTPGTEVCGDGLDNDCDGTADDGCVCVPATSQACYDGAAGTEGVGACRAGTQQCDAAGSGYGACIGAVGPVAETCGDGIDDDCDGVIDDGCVCAAGVSEACYDLATGTPGVGVCAAGSRTCNADGTAWGACAGAVGPEAELCGDGLDNDCDGVADDGCVCPPGAIQACYEGPPGTEGVGLCAAGAQRCSADGTAWGACTGAVEPVDEVCGDGLDNDCDGIADDSCVCAPATTAACYDGPAGTEGVGECRAGAQTCNASGTGYGLCVGAVVPAADVCGDGLDSDCDGVIDDGCVCVPDATAACYDGPAGTEGVGACRAGAQTCNASGTGYGACAGAVVPHAEVCGNGQDDDCDGVVDDGCIGDRVWRDGNRDGLQAPGELGVSGAVLLLRSALSGALIAVATSDAVGRYYFSGVPNGVYYIEVVPPTGLSVSEPNVGGDDAIDNDFDGEVNATEPFTFSGVGVDTIDCGLRPALGGA